MNQDIHYTLSREDASYNCFAIIKKKATIRETSEAIAYALTDEFGADKSTLRVDNLELFLDSLGVDEFKADITDEDGETYTHVIEIEQTCVY